MWESITASVSTDTGIGRIPVCLLTGFLGSGKTTVLNRLTRRPEMEGTAVLINEFGEVGIDHHLVEAVDESILLLESGCLCCSMHGDFIKTLKSLHERQSRREIPAIRRVIVETTGLADPVPIIYTLMEERYVAARYVCDSVLTVVDGNHGPDQLVHHGEAVRQVAMADRLLITKSDIADRNAREKLHIMLERLNPTAPRLQVTHGEIDPVLLFSGGLYSPSERIPNVADWLGEEALNQQAHRHSHDHGHVHGGAITSFTVCFDQPAPWRGMAVTMGRILMDYGSRLLRAKGVIGVVGTMIPMVVQCVQDVAYPPVRLAKWPADGPLSDRRGRMVFIGRGLSKEDVADIKARLTILPDDNAAMRMVATTPLLPTRCWLNQRLPWMGRGCFETDGWVVQPPVVASSRHTSLR